MEFIPFVIGFLILFMCFVSVRQGTIAVVTVFGKYSRIMRPGLNFKLPLIQQIYKCLHKTLLIHKLEGHILDGFLLLVIHSEQEMALKLTLAWSMVVA